MDIPDSIYRQAAEDLSKMKRVAVYARVSTRDQDPGLQLQDLRRYAGSRRWKICGEFLDHGVSGARESRPELDRLMEAARKRQVDLVLVWRFDRFARSTSHLLRALEEFRALGVDFVSYQENVDTSTPLGQALFTIVAAVAQLERDIIRERVQAGVNRAREAGKILGRPRVPFDLERARKLALRPGYGLREIGDKLGVSHTQVRREFLRAGIRLADRPYSWGSNGGPGGVRVPSRARGRLEQKPT